MNSAVGNSNKGCVFHVKLKFKLIYDRVSRPVCLGLRIPSGAHDQISFISLTRGWVCNLLVQLFLGLARAITLGSKSRRTHGHILLSHLRLSQPRGPGPRIYILHEQGGPVISPGTQSQSYITTDSQSASLSSCQAPIWDPQPIFPPSL
jgi:hypothetical protein